MTSVKNIGIIGAGRIGQATARTAVRAGPDFGPSDLGLIRLP
jgi:lactate dehydrogenase-like 2-hydroxyacid dehydrogenase